MNNVINTDLTGKVAVVTGGTGYLGSENVKILKDFGATVVNADIAAAETRWNKSEEGAGDMFVACDVSSAESIAEASLVHGINADELVKALNAFFDAKK